MLWLVYGNFFSLWLYEQEHMYVRTYTRIYVHDGEMLHDSCSNIKLSSARDWLLLGNSLKDIYRHEWVNG